MPKLEIKAHTGAISANHQYMVVMHVYCNRSRGYIVIKTGDCFNDCVQININFILEVLPFDLSMPAYSYTLRSNCKASHFEQALHYRVNTEL